MREFVTIRRCISGHPVKTLSSREAAAAEVVAHNAGVEAELQGKVYKEMYRSWYWYVPQHVEPIRAPTNDRGDRR